VIASRTTFLVATTRAELREATRALRATGRPLTLVPTMGSLHPGHLSLVDRARVGGGAVAVSIFVNPLQFGPDEDLERYPRDLERDLDRIAARGVELAFVPAEDEMYPGGPPRVQVDPGPQGDRLCGPFRPGHFRGVLTVVGKLFGLFRPDRAVFGRKDLQQVVLVRRMVRDLELGVEVEVAPLVREPDGLAMSSRNVFLSPGEREEALGIFRALDGADGAFRGGERSGPALLERAREILSRHPGLQVQYVELVDPASLDPVEEAREGVVLAIAATCGRTRLIDNAVLGADLPDPRVPMGSH